MRVEFERTHVLNVALSSNPRGVPPSSSSLLLCFRMARVTSTKRGSLARIPTALNAYNFHNYAKLCAQIVTV
jgi:hypothetical protein